jgi:hypothetical protein
MAQPVLKRLFCLFGVCLACLCPAAGLAQTARDGRLLVTVVDPSGAIVPDATVTVVGLETATKAIERLPVKSTDKGIATVDGLVPGRYSIQAEFPGFDLGLLRDVRVRVGDNKHLVVLPLKKIEDAVTVGPGTQSAASDRGNATFGLALSTTQIEALSDDPTELASQLTDLAGSEAIIRVDSFEGQQLPPKSQIKSIHVTRDQFAAETEFPGSTFVDVITQPGVGPIRGGANMSFRDSALNARNPFAPTKGAEQNRGYGFNIGGALATNRSNFSLSVNGRNDYTTPNLNAALPTGASTQVLNLRQPNNFVNVNALVDYALTKDQTLRFGYSQVSNTSSNLGIGAYDLEERAFSNYFSNYTFRALEAGPIGRRSFINTRMSVTWSDFGSRSTVEVPTIIVQDAFTSGGAQQAGGTHSRNVSLASDLDHVRGMHSWRTGVLVTGGWFNSDANQNYLGTYIFSSLADYQAGQPALYTRQIGDPTVSYFNGQGAVYLQDDIRLSKSLTLSPGVRYSVQTHVSDFTAVAPRFGVTWSPFKSGTTTLRASAGVFNGWLPTFILEQTLRVDGQHQRELSIVNPSFPDPGTGGVVPPTNKYVLGDFGLQRNLRYSAGVDHTFSPRLRGNVLYNYIHLSEQARGNNLNAPVAGVRPDPNFANIIEVVTDTEIRRHEVYVNATFNLTAPSPAANRDRVNWRRLTFVGAYSMIHARNNSGGPFVVPPSGSVDADWGPGGGRHAVPDQCDVDQHAGEEPGDQSQLGRERRLCVQRNDRFRRQSGRAAQRPSRGRRTPQPADRAAVDHQHASHIYVDAGERIVRNTHRARGASPLSREPVPQRDQPDESLQPWRLQRHHDVAIF